MLVRASFLLLLWSMAVCGRGQKGQDEFETLSAQRTVGQPWPMPQSITTTLDRLAVHSDSFSFLLNQTSVTCDLIENAFDRYYKLIFAPGTYMDEILQQSSASEQPKNTHPPKNNANPEDGTVLKRLEVYIQGTCEQWPRFESNESCKIVEQINLYQHLYSFSRL